MAITLTTEDGTGLENANSYIDTTFAEAYFDAQGSDLWKKNVSKRELALVQASQFLDLRYSERFGGTILTDGQGLLFPRLFNGTATEVPMGIKKATAQLAMQYLADGNLDLNANSDATVSSEEVSVGNGAVVEKKSYFKESGKAAFSAFAIADRFVEQALRSLGMMSTTVFISSVRG